MRLFRAAAAVFAVWCLAGPGARARADAPPGGPVQGGPVQGGAAQGESVRGLTVVPGPGPTVQSTYPASGAVVPSGVVILKVVFDQPMTPDAWAYGPSAGADFPHCLANPRLLADKRTYVLLCGVAQSHAYAVEINPAPRFANADGRSAQFYVLKFSTGADVTRSLPDALQQAGLADTDDPVMTWRDPGQGVSQSAPPSP